MNTNLMQRWMELVEYRITEGSEFYWDCFGAGSYRLDHWSGNSQDSPSFSITFDRHNQTVYQLEAHDYSNNRAYRWTNPDFQSQHDEESRRRGVDADQAWDDVSYVALEDLDDFFQKATAIYLGDDYDTRVTLPVEFTDEELLTYMKLAHERDITFNQLVEEAIRAAIEEHKRDPEGMKQRAQRWKHKTDAL